MFSCAPLSVDYEGSVPQAAALRAINLLAAVLPDEVLIAMRAWPSQSVVEWVQEEIQKEAKCDCKGLDRIHQCHAKA
jgi:hypothetical protein